MSKQSEAKERQQYVAKCIPGTCGNCAHMTSKMALPDWMVKKNDAGEDPPYAVEIHGFEKEMRCGIGGFKVLRMGTCLEWRSKP